MLLSFESPDKKDVHPPVLTAALLLILDSLPRSLFLIAHLITRLQNIKEHKHKIQLVAKNTISYFPEPRILLGCSEYFPEYPALTNLNIRPDVLPHRVVQPPPPPSLLPFLLLPLFPSTCSHLREAVIYVLAEFVR